LEISRKNSVFVSQGTLLSNFKETSKEPMRRGVSISYILIAACVFPLAIAGFLAYGNQVSTSQPFMCKLTDSYVKSMLFFYIIAKCW